jgi:hypothetical protein
MTMLKGYLANKKGTSVSHDLKLARLFDALPEVSSASSPASRPRRSSTPMRRTGLWSPSERCGWGRRMIASGRPRTLPDRKSRVFQGPTGRGAWVYRSTITMTDGSGMDTGMELISGEQGGRTRMTIAQGGSPAAGVRGDFVEGWVSILDGLGHTVAATITDRL